LRTESVAGDLDSDVIAPSRYPVDLAVVVYVDALSLQDICNCHRHVFILARDDTRRELNYRDFTAKAAIDLRELKSDIAAANNDQVK